MDPFFAANAALSVFSRNYMELKKGLPIRPSEMGVLNILAETPGPHTPVMLAELLGVSKPMITAHLTSLAAKGYIAKRPSGEDKRVSHILPTDKGLELVESARRDLSRQLERLQAGLGEEDFETLIRLTQQSNRIFEENRKEDRQKNR